MTDLLELFVLLFVYGQPPYFHKINGPDWQADRKDDYYNPLMHACWR